MNINYNKYDCLCCFNTNTAIESYRPTTTLHIC